MPDTPLDPDALAQLIMWRGLPFGGSPDSYIRLDAVAAHEVIKRLRPHLTIAQPEVQATSKPNQNFEFNPRELNQRGWTCGCEPGNYDTCDECQSTCNELANFLNRPEVSSDNEARSDDPQQGRME